MCGVVHVVCLAGYVAARTGGGGLGVRYRLEGGTGFVCGVHVCALFAHRSTTPNKAGDGWSMDDNQQLANGLKGFLRSFLCFFLVFFWTFFLNEAFSGCFLVVVCVCFLNTAFSGHFFVLLCFL